MLLCFYLLFPTELGLRQAWHLFSHHTLLNYCALEEQLMAPRMEREICPINARLELEAADSWIGGPGDPKVGIVNMQTSLLLGSPLLLFSG